MSKKSLAKATLRDPAKHKLSPIITRIKQSRTTRSSCRNWKNAFLVAFQRRSETASSPSSSSIREKIVSSLAVDIQNHFHPYFEFSSTVQHDEPLDQVVLRQLSAAAGEPLEFFEPRSWSRLGQRPEDPQAEQELAPAQEEADLEGEEAAERGGSGELQRQSEGGSAKADRAGANQFPEDQGVQRAENSNR